MKTQYTTPTRQTPARRIVGTLLAFAMLSISVSLSGCRCCQWSNCYYDKIDDISDHEPCMDRFYDARFDISRAGMPDWCQGKLNRKICPCRCNGISCRHKPIMYPSTYRAKYQKHLADEAAKQKQQQLDPTASPVPPLP